MNENFIIPRSEVEADNYQQNMNVVQIELMQRMGYADNDDMMTWIGKYSKDFREYVESHETIHKHIEHGDVSDVDYKELLEMFNSSKATVH